MKSSNALLKTSSITTKDIESLLAMRESLDSLKKRYELLEDSVKTTEADIISKLENGVQVDSAFQLLIRVSERRYPSWKSCFIEIAGASAAEQVLARTTPTTYKSLLIKGRE